MATSTEVSVPKKGIVKFFGTSYGFFTDEDGVDAHVRNTTLEKFGFTPRDIVRDAEVVYETKQHSDGLKVSAIISIGKKYALEPCSSKYQPPIIKPSFTDEHVGQEIIAKVKFYRADKLFGFLEIINPSNYEDTFFHLDGVSDDHIKRELRRERMLKGTMVTATIAMHPKKTDGGIIIMKPVALITGFYVPPEVSDEPGDDLPEPKLLADIDFMSLSVSG
jgi:cold shock CspA family protein